MKQRRTHVLVIAIAAVLTLSWSGSAFAFGIGKKLPVKTTKFDTKPMQKVLESMDGLQAEFAAATDMFWGATEQFQSVIQPYAEGEFPILTQNWEFVKKELAEAKADAEKQAAFDLRKGYYKEIMARKKYIEGMLSDPVKASGIQLKLQTGDIDKLQGAAKTLQEAIKKDTKVVKDIPGTLKKVPDMTKKLTEQITKDPLKAGDYKSLLGKLTDGQKQLTEVPPEAEKQVKAGESMLGSITKLVKK